MYLLFTVNKEWSFPAGSPPPPPPINDLPPPQFDEDDLPQPEEDPYAATGPEMFATAVPDTYLEKGKIVWTIVIHDNYLE